MLVYSGSVVAGVTGFLQELSVETQEFQVMMMMMMMMMRTMMMTMMSSRTPALGTDCRG